MTQEPYILKLNKDQIVQLLSALWLQANMPDNLPANVEAIVQSFCLTLISSRVKVNTQVIHIMMLKNKTKKKLNKWSDCQFSVVAENQQ